MMADDRDGGPEAMTFRQRLRKFVRPASPKLHVNPTVIEHERKRARSRTA
jgi:hypothetical protein